MSLLCGQSRDSGSPYLCPPVPIFTPPGHPLTSFLPLVHGAKTSLQEWREVGSRLLDVESLQTRKRKPFVCTMKTATPRRGLMGSGGFMYCPHVFSILLPSWLREGTVGKLRKQTNPSAIWPYVEAPLFMGHWPCLRSSKMAIGLSR